MSLRDHANSIEPPEPLGHVDVGPDGGEFTDIRTTEPLTDWTHIFARFGLDPNLFEIVDDTVRMSHWQQSARTADGDRDLINLYSYRAQFRRRMDTIDLPALYMTANASSTPPKSRKASNSTHATVVVFADPQIGKTGRRGGTPELIARIAEKRAQLKQLLEHRKPSRLVLADAGDGFEGFNSGGNPMFTNDLSLAQQMDAYGVELFKFIELMCVHGPVDVLAVPSNHTAWRNGKQQLGNPQDDLGLFVHRQVQKIVEAKGLDATWHYPAPYDESVAVDVDGTRIGLVHGNQFNSGQCVQWWEKQTFGAQAVAGCDVLVHGHYHSFAANVAGRNPVTSRQRWALGAPTLDNGSDWYRQIAGRDSDPGLLVFDVDVSGFDLGSLVIL